MLEAVGFEADYVHGDIGWEFWCKEGNALPERTIDLLEKHKLGLFGAITSQAEGQGRGRADPGAAGQGLRRTTARSSSMRQHFDLDICIRPCQSFPGNPLNFIRRKARRRLRGAEGRRGHLPPEHRGPLLRRRVDQPARAGARRRSRPTRSEARSTNVPGRGPGHLAAHLHARRRASGSARRPSSTRRSSATSRSRSARSRTSSARPPA